MLQETEKVAFVVYCVFNWHFRILMAFGFQHGLLTQPFQLSVCVLQNLGICRKGLLTADR